MSNIEIQQMMADLTSKEEKRLGIGSPEFIQRHNEIMGETNRQLLYDLRMEQQEGA